VLHFIGNGFVGVQNELSPSRSCFHVFINDLLTFAQKAFADEAPQKLKLRVKVDSCQGCPRHHDIFHDRGIQLLASNFSGWNREDSHLTLLEVTEVDFTL
jgi:hypothetical protein